MDEVIRAGEITSTGEPPPEAPSPEAVREAPSVASEAAQRVYDHKPIFEALPELRVQLASLKVLHRMATGGLLPKEQPTPPGLKGLHPHQITEGIARTRAQLEAFKELAAELEASEHGIAEPTATPLSIAPSASGLIVPELRMPGPGPGEPGLE